MTTTCAGCGKTDDRNLYYWTRDREGYWWHPGCRSAALENELSLLQRPIQERHDGATTRDHRGRKASR
jgi:hypothetical protein